MAIGRIFCGAASRPHLAYFDAFRLSSIVCRATARSTRNGKLPDRRNRSCNALRSWDLLLLADNVRHHIRALSNRGAFLLALMGAAGMLSSAFAVPMVGRMYDRWGPAKALSSVAIVPIVPAVILALIWLIIRIGKFDAPRRKSSPEA